MQTVLTMISFICTLVCISCLLYLSKLKHDKKLDRSAWMFCKTCNVKWRPTAFGPPTPDDCYCPVCHKSTGQYGMDRHNKIREVAV